MPNDDRPREFWDDQKLTHVRIPMDILKEKMGIQHRVMDIEIDPYLNYIDVTLDTIHFQQ